jgi:RHS repeat-associated protein
MPSHDYGLSELHSGQVDIDLNLAETTAGNVTLIDSNGGTVNGPGGLHLVVPPNAATGNTLLTLSPVIPASLPGGAGKRSDFVGGFDLSISAGGLDPLAAYQLGLGTTVADGQDFVVGRYESGVASFTLATLGHSDGGDVAVDACPAGLDGCLSGLSSGEYAVFALPGATALVTGTVADSTGPRSAIPVTSDQLAVVSIADASGHYVLPAPVGVSSTLTTRDAVNDLSGSASVLPSPDSQLPAPPLTADIELQPSPPTVVQISPANHASQVDRSATVTVTFSKAIDSATINDASVQLSVVSGQSSAGVNARLSLSSDGTQLVITPTDLLAPNALYQLTLSSAITDKHGNGLQWSGVSGQGSGCGSPVSGLPSPDCAFSSDFTTAAVFKADALPPNTLRISLPDDGTGNVPPIGAVGQVFVCGGANLAAPGTAVIVSNATSQTTYTATATDTGGVSGSDVCDALFAGRCDTSQPGSFCAVIDAAVGDKVQVQVQDVLHNTVTLDTGNMRDERTGATVIDTAGGVVSFPADQRYQALIPDGAFAQPTIVQITPITANGPGLSLADYPVLTSLDQSKIELIGAVQVDLTPPGTVAQQNFDVTVPAPADATADDQYIATQVVNFRGLDEQTMIDTATFDAAGCATDMQKCLVTTDDSVFPGLTIGGTFGVQRAAECLAYATGWISIGDYYNNGYVPGGDMGAMLPFPVQVTEPVRFAVPLPCNQSVPVKLQTFSDQPIAQQVVEMPGQGQTVELPRRLTDSTTLPMAQPAQPWDPSAPAVPWRPVQITFTHAIDPGTVNSTTARVTDGSGNTVSGHWELSADGLTLTFVPDVRFPYDQFFTLSLSGLKDTNGLPLAVPIVRHFFTAHPVVEQRIVMDARDVVVLDPTSLGLRAERRLIAVAEGDALRADFAGGISIFDVTDLTSPAQELASVATAGVDRAVVFVPGPPVTTTGAQPGSYNGPFLMSVDGPGEPDRFGMWRLFDLGRFPAITQVADRFLNQSAQSWDQFNLQDPTLPPPPDFLKFIPNDLGIPEDLAAVDTQIAYIANAPNIGLQGIMVQGMNADELAGPQVDGTLTGLYRGVSILKNNILAVRQDGAANTLVLAGAQLNGVSDTYALPQQGRPLAVRGLADWPTRVDSTGTNGQTTSSTSPFDLAVVSCAGCGMSVVPVNGAGGAGGGSFAPLSLPGGVGQLNTPGQDSRGAVGDPSTQLLYVADGTTGLTVIDFAQPGGTRDANHDGIDDRVLGSVALPVPLVAAGVQPDHVAVAMQVAHYWPAVPTPSATPGATAAPNPIEVVAAEADGLYLIGEPGALQVKKPTVEDCANAIDNDVIGCEDQTLGAVADVVGTPFTLHYQSDRTPGGNVLLITISNDTVPATVTRFDVTVNVAGRTFNQSLPPKPDQQLLFAWDGKDSSGNVLLGAQWATIEVDDVYASNGADQPRSVRLWGGTLGTWDTRALGLGGWSFNVLHYYDPLDQILYLGDGSRRGGARLGVVKVDATSGETFIASEDGLAIYVFDSLTGRHLWTLHGLTKAVVYSFSYDGDGKLTGITDGDGNVTTVAPSGITGPFGETTTVSAVTNDFWTAISQGVGTTTLSLYPPSSSPFADVATSTPFADGVLQSLQDPRGKQWQYTFNALGQVQKDGDPAGGSIALSRQDSTPADGVIDNYKVSLKTAGGKAFDHGVINYADGRRHRDIGTPDGSTTIDIGANLSATATYPGGNASSTYVPGQKASVNAGLPGGWGSLIANHAVTWNDPSDPQTISGAGDTVNFNGATASTTASGSTVTTTTPGGRTITTQIDSQGRPTNINLPGLPAIGVTYDSGRVKTLTQSTRSLTFGYTNAFVSSVTDSLGRTLALTRDAAGHVTGQSLPGQNFTITPDADGDVAAISSPQAGGYSESASYTPVDLLSSYTVPAGQTSITYDVDRTPTGGTSPWGALSFDSKGRLTGVGQTTYAYDTDGNLTGITSPDGTLTFGGAPVPTSVTWTGTVSGTLQIGRNALFQATSFTAGGQQITRDIDADGVVTRAGALTIQRSAAGFVQGTTLSQEGSAPAITETYTLNDFGEPTHYTARVGGNVAADVAYIRDAGGRITSKTESIIDPLTGALVTGSQAYTYDDAGRLACVYHDGQLLAHHTYDDAGNRTGSLSTCGTDTVVPQVPGVATVEAATIGTQNQLMAATVRDAFGVEHHYAYSYDPSALASLPEALRYRAQAVPSSRYDWLGLVDPAGVAAAQGSDEPTPTPTGGPGGTVTIGALSAKTDLDTNETTTYQYDLFGNLRSVTRPGVQIQYLVDAANRRVGKKVNGTRVQGLLYQDSLRPVAELDTNNNVTRVFVYGSKGNVPDYIENADGTRQRIISDQVGSVRLVLDATTGAILQRLDYDEYGAVILDTNPGFQPFGYAGGLYDPDTRMVRFGARDYDPEMGRWTARDPIGFDGGDGNLYGYALGDPVNLIDPPGLQQSGNPEWVPYVGDIPYDEHCPTRSFEEEAACTASSVLNVSSTLCVLGPEGCGVGWTLAGIAGSFGTGVCAARKSDVVGAGLSITELLTIEQPALSRPLTWVDYARSLAGDSYRVRFRDCLEYTAALECLGRPTGPIYNSSGTVVYGCKK